MNQQEKGAREKEDETAKRRTRQLTILQLIFRLLLSLLHLSRISFAFALKRPTISILFRSVFGAVSSVRAASLGGPSASAPCIIQFSAIATLFIL